MDVTGVIILAAICIVIGFLLGALLISMRRESSSREPSPETTLPESGELRLWHRGKDKRLVIVLDGVSYQRDTDLKPEQSQRLIRYIKELQTWMGGMAEIPDPSPHLSSDPLPTPADQTVDKVKGPSLNPLQVFNLPKSSSSQTDQDEFDRSIVTQIDEILQARLEDKPLADRGIRMVEGPDRGMVIEVGLSRYTDIDDIPDKEIRRVIRQSVKEWEGRMEDHQ
jgi:hypothetical protein